MNLQSAQELAREVVAILQSHCSRIEVAGSIRRRKPWPRDIDIILIPRNQGALAVALQGLGHPVKAGDKIVTRVYKGVQVDIYIASPETWACLLLIRTGSKEHNVQLTTRARERRWHLYANGRGLVDHLNNRLAGDTEESFFEALGLPFKQPWERG